MNWDRLAGYWQGLTRPARQRWRGRKTRQASEKQLAEWLERQHKADPIHK
jgi:hypothetical protein